MDILIISGLSGGGKSKTASFLEDMGFYVVDNMPAVMILKFAEFCAGGSGRYERVALVYDVRTADSFDELFSVLDTLKRTQSSCQMLFLEATTQAIIKRYKESRRRHPLAVDGTSLEEAVRQEVALMKEVKQRSDFVINTTDLPTTTLRNKLTHLFDKHEEKGKMQVQVVSFGFKNGIPLEADLVFDVRFMPNPFYIEELRPKTGLDHEVYDYVMKFQQTQDYLVQLKSLLAFSLPLHAEEGKLSLVIAIGCTGGHHRSVSVSRAIGEFVSQAGYEVSMIHRDIPRNHS